jgi:hypothetical protein
MTDPPEDVRNTKGLLGWIGALCLLAIIPMKLLRVLNVPNPTAGIVDVAPSVLGPAGLLFLIRSSRGRLSRLPLFQTALLVGSLAAGLELLQLVPRPGILAQIRYSFDGLDLVASLLSVVAAYFVARVVLGSAHPP